MIPVLGSRTVCSVLTLQVLTERTDLLIKHTTYDEAKQLLGSWSVDDFCGHIGCNQCGFNDVEATVLIARLLEAQEVHQS